MTTIDREACTALEPLARRAFTEAVIAGTAGELLWRLYNGEALSFDPGSNKIIYLPASFFEQTTTEGEPT